MSDINRQFDIDIDKFAKQTGIAVGLLTKHVALKTFTGVVQRTPVDTGVARASWEIGVGVDPGPTMPDYDILSKAAKIKTAPAYTAIFISNYVPYIVALEDGHSQQAPSGMVEVTVNEVKSELRDLTR